LDNLSSTKRIDKVYKPKPNMVSEFDDDSLIFPKIKKTKPVKVKKEKIVKVKKEKIKSTPEEIELKKKMHREKMLEYYKEYQIKYREKIKQRKKLKYELNKAAKKK
jgi:hypothetical protein